MFEEVQKRQRRQLSGLGWVMIVFGGLVAACGVCGIVFPDLFVLWLSRPMAIRGALAGFVIAVLGVVSVVRARRSS